FSRRRRHTKSKRDWSSDVCSSDLPARSGALRRVDFRRSRTISAGRSPARLKIRVAAYQSCKAPLTCKERFTYAEVSSHAHHFQRSEERRVGTAYTSEGWTPHHIE